MSNETNEIENLQGKHRYGVGITLDGDLGVFSCTWWSTPEEADKISKDMHATCMNNETGKPGWQLKKKDALIDCFNRYEIKHQFTPTTTMAHL